MRFHQFTLPTTSHTLRDPFPNEALLLVFPEEISDLKALIKEHGGIEIVDRHQPGINDGILYLIRCEDEWAVEGLERAWKFFRIFRRKLPPHRGPQST
jgi:hypothetical protein